MTGQVRDEEDHHSICIAPQASAVFGTKVDSLGRVYLMIILNMGGIVYA